MNVKGSGTGAGIGVAEVAAASGAGDPVDAAGFRAGLRDWLDQNLPPMVERMVQREIEKMVRRAQGG